MFHVVYNSIRKFTIITIIKFIYLYHNNELIISIIDVSKLSYSPNDVDDDDNDDKASDYEMTCADGDDLKMNSESTQLDNDNLIYPNARITNQVSMLLIMTFAIVNKLSGSALKDLLSLIDLHCPVPYRLISSLYKFKHSILRL